MVALRREEIARCAARLLVRKGYDRASVREIADACGMSMGTLYHYVGIKEDILYLVISHGLSMYAGFLGEIAASLDVMNPIESLIHAVQEFYRRIDRFQDFTVFIYQETKNLSLQSRQLVLDEERRLITAFERVLTKGCETGEFKIDNVKLAAHEIVVAGEMWAVRRWFLRKHYTLEEYIRQQTELILKFSLPISFDKGDRS